MAVTAGYVGTFKYGGSYMGGVTSASVSAVMDQLDTSALATTSGGIRGKSMILGMYQYTVSLNIDLDAADTVQDTFRANAASGTSATVVMEEAYGSVEWFTATMYITDFTRNVEPSGKQTATATLVSTGNVTIAAI